MQLFWNPVSSCLLLMSLRSSQHHASRWRKKAVPQGRASPFLTGHRSGASLRLTVRLGVLVTQFSLDEVCPGGKGSKVWSIHG